MPNRLLKRGASKRERLDVILLIALFLLSCTGTQYLKESTSFLIEEVPFFPQETFQCGPASLAGVLNYWGVHVTPEEIAKDIYSPSAGGTLNLDMILYSEKKGMKVKHYPGSFEDIKNKIDRGYPIIVLVDLGLFAYQQNHFMVVVGYDENGMIANSGKDRLKTIATKSFMKAWKKTNYWTLWIAPLR